MSANIEMKSSESEAPLRGKEVKAMAENKKLNFSTANIIEFVKRDLFNRTLYNTEKYFTSLCDLVITNL